MCTPVLLGWGQETGYPIGQTIAMRTGSGTFNAGAPRAVTGGGTYRVSDPQGGPMFSGTYRVTEVLFWEEAPGVWTPATQSRIAPIEDHRAGLAVLRLAYSDGNQGVLVVSCRAPTQTPPPVFEGIVAAHSHTFFWNHGLAQSAPFVNENRTAFALLRRPAALPRTGEADVDAVEHEPEYEPVEEAAGEE